MDKSHSQDRMEEQFMQNIAERLGRKRRVERPDHPYRGAPRFWQEFNHSTEENIRLFIDNWQEVGGHAYHFESLEQAKLMIIQIAEETKAQYLILNNEEPLQRMQLEGELVDVEMTTWRHDEATSLKAKAAGADIGIVVADYAVSMTGSVVLTSNEHQGRSVSLLPTALMIIVPSERIKTRMGEVMHELNQLTPSQMPAGVHFVSGPSRSADIENDLTIGVHGPGIVYALIVDKM